MLASKERAGRDQQPALLSVPDSLEGVAVPAPAPRLDLDEHDHPAIVDDQIDLAAGAGEATGDKATSLPLQVPRRELLRGAAGGVPPAWVGRGWGRRAHIMM